jgi:hypothetical protein
VIPRDRLRDAAPALVGLALLVLFFASTLDPRVQLYYRDTGRLYYPVKLFIAQQLRAGRLPLWDPWTECGVSLLGQVTPALLHPATLLYLALPFDLAFKLNHMLGPLLAGIGAFRLGRRLGASAWAALAGAIAYAGCGYLVSVTGSNLPYAVGAGSVPLAVDAVLRLVERPSPGRFAWAGAAVALIAYAGEPQAMLIAGLLSGAWALALAFPERRLALRNLGLVAACGALALAFSAPAVFPAVVELRHSTRGGPLSEKERAAFANHPLRLAGLLVPRAFDDAPEASGDARAASTYTEYFTEGSAAFADSIVLGAPALLLAFAGAFAGGKGKLLLGGACLLALASAGTSLGVDRALFALVPLSGIFRYAEKLSAPASLLFALAAALGADLALSGTRRAAFRLAAAALVLAGSAAALALYAGANAAHLAEALVVLGKTHRMAFAHAFWREARAGLFDCAGLAAALGAVALLRWWRQRPALALGALCCAASVFASCGGLLYSAPVAVVRGPFDLAERLRARAGPSAGRWRLFVNDRDPLLLAGFAPRVSVTVSMAQALLPQFNVVAGIEGMSPYFSAADPAYVHGIRETPETYFNLFGVRFAVEMPDSFSPAQARLRNFHQVGLGYWVREYPVFSRAFVVAKAARVATVDEGIAQVAAPGFDVRRQAVMRGEGLPPLLEGTAAPAHQERTSPGRLTVHARGPGLLVVGEHFDPGWRATVDGAAVPVVEADLAALGVALPASEHTVVLRFVPVGLWPGALFAAAAAAALGGVAWSRRKSVKSG